MRGWTPVGRLLLLASLGSCGGSMTTGPETLNHAYVISALRIDASDGDVAPGFDLDGMVSTGAGPGCVDRAADFRSPPDDPGRDGIDNALAPYAEVLGRATPGCAGRRGVDCLADELTRSIAERPMLWIIHVADVQSYRRDDHVQVSVLRAELSRPLELWDGRLAPEQDFRGALVAQDLDAHIADGRLEAVLDRPIPLELPLGGEVVPLTLHRARIAVPEMRPSALSRAVLGGAVEVGEWTASACRLVSDDCDDVASSDLPDLDPDEGDPTRCESLSAALTFDAVSAHLTAP